MAEGIAASTPEIAALTANLLRKRATHQGFDQQTLATEAGISTATLRKVWQPKR